MSIETRLDSRSKNNSSIMVRNENDEVVAEIFAVNGSTGLKVITSNGHYVAKHSGWQSNKGNKKA